MKNNSYRPCDVVARLNLSNATTENAFEAALEAYGKDALFCIPERARNIVARKGKETTFVLLGTKDFGASFVSSLGDRGRVAFAVDDFKCHRGEDFRGVEIISTDKFLGLAADDPDVIALNSCRYDYSRRFFESLCDAHGIPCLNFEQAVRLLCLNEAIDYRLADWGPSIEARCDEYRQLTHRLNDPYSIETLYGVLLFQLTCNPEWHLNVGRPYPSLYFRSGLFSFSDNEKFVDCGASIGESTSGLIGVTQGRFGHSWMIEPDRFNIETLTKFRRRFRGTKLESKLSLHPFAVGEAEATAPFHHQGGHGGFMGSPNDTDLQTVQVRSIDSVVDDIPTFIKMDIEGFELPGLRGSANAIRDGMPKLAISAYHRADDLLELTHFVDSIAPGYKLGLRHHTEDRWDTCLYFYK